MKALDRFAHPAGYPRAGRRAGLIRPAITALATGAIVAAGLAGSLLEHDTRPRHRGTAPDPWWFTAGDVAAVVVLVPLALTREALTRLTVARDRWRDRAHATRSTP